MIKNNILESPRHVYAGDSKIKMDTYNYIIDPDQIGSVKRRLLNQQMKAILSVMFITDITQYVLNGHTRLIIIIAAVIITSLLLFGITFISTNRIIKSYKTLQVVLNEHGIEVNAKRMPYKFINWAKIVIEEKANGTINVFDRSFSSFSRKAFGKGWIVIQPEMLNRGDLLAEMNKHKGCHLHI